MKVLQNKVSLNIRFDELKCRIAKLKLSKGSVQPDISCKEPDENKLNWVGRVRVEVTVVNFERFRMNGRVFVWSKDFLTE